MRRLVEKDFGWIDGPQLIVLTGALIVVIVLGSVTRDTLVCLTAGLLGANFSLAVGTWRYTRETRRLADTAAAERQSSEEAVAAMLDHVKATERVAAATEASLQILLRQTAALELSASIEQEAREDRSSAELTLTTTAQSRREGECLNTFSLENKGPAQAEIHTVCPLPDALRVVRFQHEEPPFQLDAGRAAQFWLAVPAQDLDALVSAGPMVEVRFTDKTAKEKRQSWALTFGAGGTVEAVRKQELAA
jgi:hypothetical protein